MQEVVKELGPFDSRAWSARHRNVCEGNGPDEIDQTYKCQALDKFSKAYK
jgi:hypothetical protein